MYLIPPMDDEPPPEYVDFVTAHVRDLRREALRLVGGDPIGHAISQDVLTDLAGHWRRLRWWGRLTRSDAAGGYLRRRLAARTRDWREDQVYEVEVRVLRPPEPVVAPAPPAGSIALRKATVLEGTARASLAALADAEIAWVHAWRRSQWHRVARLAGGGVLLLGGIVQYVTWLGTAGG